MQVTLGIDVACRADHQASLADGAGEFVWSGHRFRTTPVDLEALWDKIPDGAEVTVVLEPTRNAWVPLAAWLGAKGATVVMVPPEQSADLRNYYNKHTKTDRLDSRVLARLPLLHPEGLKPIDSLGPAEPLKRAVRHRTSLIKRRAASMLRLDALVELLGPAYADVLGTGDYNKTALMVLERFADPRALKKLGRKRLAAAMIRSSRGAWSEAKADELLAAADETLELWAVAGGLDFAELAEDIALEARHIRQLNDEIAAIEDRIEAIYDDVDPNGIFASGPGMGTTLAAGILGRLGDPNRFDNLAGIRSFTGLVPKVNQSGTADHHGGPTKAADPGLREAVFLAAEHARKVDPTLAARYHRLIVENGKHHNSAVCTIAGVLITRLAACWRNGQRYVIRDLDGNEITPEQGRIICAEQFKIPPAVRAARRSTTQAKKLKARTGRRSEESTRAAPATGPSTSDATALKIA
ncbi:MAG: IS110 family transposase [Acidimicrobiales bacterium]